MASKNISELSLTITRVAGGLVYLAIPDGANPYGFSDRAITVENFEAYLQGQIDDLILITDDLDDRITDLEAVGNDDVLREDQNTNFQLLTGSLSILKRVTVRVVSDTLTSFKIGTTDGGDEILRDQTDITTQTTFSFNKSFEIDDVLFFTIVGATIDLFIEKREGIFN